MSGAIVSELMAAMELLRKDPRSLVERTAALARARWLFRGQSLGRGVSVYSHLHAEIRGRLSIGSRTSFMGLVLPSTIVVHEGAVLEIGEGSVFNYGVSIEASERITIGKRCMFGSYVRIADGDPKGARPVTLEDDVWIAHGAIISSGVTIGAGSVVAAGSVVTSDVPPRSLAVGNPARAMSLALRVGEAVQPPV